MVYNSYEKVYKEHGMGKYDDIIDLPHHVSKIHPQMSIWTAQHSLHLLRHVTGHEEAIAETARLTNEWHEPDEDKKESLMRK